MHVVESLQNAPRRYEKTDARTDPTRRWCEMDCHSVVGGDRKSNCQGKKIALDKVH